MQKVLHNPLSKKNVRSYEEKKIEVGMNTEKVGHKIIGVRVQQTPRIKINHKKEAI